MRYPLAVRSSSLLEDSHYLPFAGIYATYMLANDDPNAKKRMDRLLAAIKRVYASAFLQQAKSYLAATPYRLEEEKMAVILQRVVGAARGERFYPDLAGVGRSHNFYPVPPMTADAGVAAVGLGLGDTVVNGARVCPVLPARSAASRAVLVGQGRAAELAAHVLRVAARRNATRRRPRMAISSCASTASTRRKPTARWPWSDRRGRPRTTSSMTGCLGPASGVVSFAPILKHGMFPLAPILDRLLQIGSEGTGSAVEIEFAVNLPSSPRQLRGVRVPPAAATGRVA